MKNFGAMFLGKKIKVIKEIYESKLLKLNSTESKKKIKMDTYMISFEDTVKMTTVWYKNYYQKKNKIQKFSEKQIVDYIKKKGNRTRKKLLILKSLNYFKIKFIKFFLKNFF